MDLNLQSIIPIITSFGLGGFITLLVKSYLDNRRKKFEGEFSHKEKRYKALMILMWAAIDFETEFEKLKRHRPNITTKEILIKELQLELYNGILYAHNDVLKTLKVFISNLDYSSYLNVALAMRKDLYDKKSKIRIDDLKIEPNKKAPPK